MRPKITDAKPAFVSHSRETGSDYVIYIDAPARSEASGPMPAVLLMDGDFFFDAAVLACRSQVAAGRIPPTVVVGVGYGAGIGEPGNSRGRDYTPTASPDEPSSGGADRFLDYLVGTLWPELARRHPLREAGRAIAGHSLGSLLVLHALFQARPFFDLALASAPSVWWDNRSILGERARRRPLPRRRLRRHALDARRHGPPRGAAEATALRGTARGFGAVPGPRPLQRPPQHAEGRTCLAPRLGFP
jgi:predicted alpha/beta superfamily hydrolase